MRSRPRTSGSRSRARTSSGSRAKGALPVQIISRDEILQQRRHERDGDPEPDLREQQRRQRLARQRDRRDDVLATRRRRCAAWAGSSTLVLVNGKRLGTFAGGITGAEGVNLAAIPFAAIERVEVLKDGASAIYGSDAIARRDQLHHAPGLLGRRRARLYGGTPTRERRRRQQPVPGNGDRSASGDLAKDKYNAFVSFNYSRVEDRWTRTSATSRSTNYLPAIDLDTTSGQTFPGYISSGSEATGPIGNPGYPNCAPSIVVGTRCRFDPAAYPGVESLPDTKQLNLFGAATLPDQQRLARHSSPGSTRSRKRASSSSRCRFPTRSSRRRPRRARSDVILPADEPVLSAPAARSTHGVDGQPLNVRYRAVENGNRDTTDTNEAWQIVAGVQGHRVELGLGRHRSTTARTRPRRS